MIVNYKTKTIQIKIVYYGCALSGKTTSLKSLMKKFNRNDELTSIETTTGRTLFFDFGTLQMKGGDWSIKILLFSATGQDFYASTRPATLSGADGIIFMIDSQKKFFEENLNSWRELNYYNENIKHIPIILSLNKQDLPDIIDIQTIVTEFKLNEYEKINIVKTIAIDGEGVLEAFKKLITFIFPTILIR